MYRWLVSIIAASVYLCSGFAVAQPRPGYSPTSTHLFPAGAQRGTQVKLRVGAECIPPGTEFRVRGASLDQVQRLTKELTFSGEPSPKRPPETVPITYPREWAAAIKIPADTEIGPVFWRLHCAQGGTASRPFIIGDLAEHVEQESNSSFTRAERVELPITLNGQICGERDVDHFRFKVEAGQSVSCEVVAARLGSKLDAVVSLLDNQGRKVNAEQFHMGNDPVLVFRSPTTAEYTLQISNVTHRGDPSFVYRVNVRPQPFLRAVFPGGGIPNTNLKLTALAVTGDQRTIFEQMDIALPDSSPKHISWTLPIGEFGTLPIAADRNRSISVLANSPSHVLEIPSSLYGQFANKDDLDEFQVTLKKGDSIRVDCQAWPPGSPAYPVIELRSKSGKRLARAASVDSKNNVAEFRYTAKTDEPLKLKIFDLRYGSQGAVDFTYRASVQTDTPDFDLFVASDSLTATQGQTATFTVEVKRRGGLDQPITLNFGSIASPVLSSTTAVDATPADQNPTKPTRQPTFPSGVTIGKTGSTFEIGKGKADARIKLTVAADARCASYPLQIVGSCEVDGKVMRRVARCRHLGVDFEGVSVGPSSTDVFHLSIQHKPLFKVECSEHYQYAYRGSVYPYEMNIERLNGFNGPIYMQRGDRQNRDMDGVEIWNATSKPEQSKVIVPIYLPETMSINVQSQTQLYSQAWAKFTDQHGQQQSMLVLANKRNMLRSLPPVVKLRSIDESIIAKPGEVVTCRLQLKRTSNFPGPMQLRLLDLAALAKRGIHVNAVDILEGQRNVDVAIRFDKTFDKQSLQLQFRAQGELDRFTVISETTVNVK